MEAIPLADKKIKLELTTRYLIDQEPPDFKLPLFASRRAILEAPYGTMDYIKNAVLKENVSCSTS